MAEQVLSSSETRGAAGKESPAFALSPPQVSLPKGGGSVRGIGDKFAANPVTGTGSMSVPIALTPGRAGFGPQLTLSYDSGSGNGPFGLGWALSTPAIRCKTDKGLPTYLDGDEADTFLLAGAEDLVPELADASSSGEPRRLFQDDVRWASKHYRVFQYRPRTEGLFARIERWAERGNPVNTFWRTISRDNVTTWYGREANSRVFDPADPRRIFEWLICLSHDDKGNAALYKYAADDPRRLTTSTPWEVNRQASARTSNRYLKRVRYGNVTPFLPAMRPDRADRTPTRWLFEAVLDYGDHAERNPRPQRLAAPPRSHWLNRPDAFSAHRAGFEVRSYRLCRRVLMFHHFDGEPGVGNNCLVRATEFHYAIPQQVDAAEQAGYTTLLSVTNRSYQRRPGPSTDYESRALPPVSFAYSTPKVEPTVHTIDPGQLANLPIGTQGPGYRWLDLDGEGLSGVLSEDRGAWYYKPNLGDGRFGPTRAVAQAPALAVAAGSSHQFMDLAGDGAIDVVDFSGPAPGYHERDAAQSWKRHVPFARLPNIDWQDPNLRFVDLTGDGHADALITEQDVFTWYPSLDERGFDAARRQHLPADEDSGPRLVFADGTQTIFLADMCGDGLTDLVRIRNGDVCYWPNQGYGRFGRKVTLGNAPRFDAPDLFDPDRIRLTDIDGSGPVDIIYLGRDGARLYFNRSGNSLSNPLTVPLPVATHNLAAVQVADLLGNGTACLVWNSHLPADAGHPVCYIDLMAGPRANAAAVQAHRNHEKPHLLIQVDNHLGATTDIEYTPSTRFYLQDQQAGTPWATRLPFPVHCVSKVTVRDAWRKTEFSSTYSYHHGYFDGEEREFRGFGRVEQVDAQAFTEAAVANAASSFFTQDHMLFQAPVKTITWYHTGLAEDRSQILSLFAREYAPARYAAAFAADSFTEPTLPQPEVDPGPGPALTGDEWREAMRACKGMPLRQEVVELDAKTLEQTGQHVPVRLFSAAQHNCHLRRVQPRGANRHAVFLALQSESYTCHYELDLTAGSLKIDPRISHTLNLCFDEWGNALQSVAVVYPRRTPFADPRLALHQVDLVRAAQDERHIAYTEARFTAPWAASGVHHRLPLLCEVRTYELTGDDSISGFTPDRQPYFTRADFLKFQLSDHLADQGAKPVLTLAYHEQPRGGAAHKRLVEHVRTLYWDDGSDSTAPSKELAFGKHGPRGLKYEDYKLALTDGLLTAVFGTGTATTPPTDKLDWEAVPAANGQAAKTCRDLLRSPSTSGYVPGNAPGLDGTADQYWMRSGTAGFQSDAHLHFFLPERFTDAFGNTTTLQYDARDLFVQSSRDALGNTVAVMRFDYRVLAPTRLRDANRNHSEVALDVHGLPVASAVLGKVTQPAAGAEITEAGDTVANLSFADLNPTPQAVSEFFLKPDFDTSTARRWLGKATARFVYHFGEERDASGNVIRWGATAAGACSVLRERHERDFPNLPSASNFPMQVAFEYSDGAGQAFVKKVRAEPDASLPAAQQVVRWITNGKTIVNNKGKPVLQFEPYFSPRGHRFAEPQAVGVSPVMFYDAAGRAVRIELPDGTFSKVEFSPWFSRSFDANDTVRQSRWYRERGSPNPTTPLRRDLAGRLLDTDDFRAAWLAARHADTPAETHFDSLGREVVAIAHNRAPDPARRPTIEWSVSDWEWADELSLTFTKLDAEGKPLWIRDARGNLVMQYITPVKPTRWADEANESVPAGSTPCYDIAGNLLYQHSMDVGDRWMLMDAAGKPMLAWDYNERQDDAGTFHQEHRLYTTDYDALHRPLAQSLRIWSRQSNSNQGFAAQPRLQIERFDYQDALAADTANLNGQAVSHVDSSGRVQTLRRDFSGNVESVRRTFASDSTASVVDWSTAIAGSDARLEGVHYAQLTEHDALGRMTRLYNWHRPGRPVAVYEPQYNLRGALASEEIVIGATKTTDSYDRATGKRAQAIQSITHDAKGQKLSLELANGTVTTYTYDPNNFRLTSLQTTRPGRTQTLQSLHYTYDPAGNITRIRDDAQQTIWFNNQQVEPHCNYTYDALYRLIEATGRESDQHLGSPKSPEGNWPGVQIPTDHMLRSYTQRYVYDSVGNFRRMQHRAGTGSWTRYYGTAEDSNRLLRTWEGDESWNSGTATQKTDYGHDPHGSMLNLKPSPGNFNLRWDHRDMIRHIDLGGGGKAWYQYDSGKQRSRKHITRQPAPTDTDRTLKEDRIYLGGFERYRRYTNDPDDPIEEIESHHLFEGEQRVLLVDDVLETDRTHANGTSYRTEPIFRYQYSNHLGSASLEMDESAEIISCEEYHPYGTSSYRVMKSGIEAPAKRYRYTGMERDEESGLNYHATRYFLASLCRWISADTVGIAGGLNLYSFVNGSPVLATDKSGLAEDPPSQGGVRITNSKPKVNLLSVDDWKLWHVGSHNVIGTGKFGAMIPLQPKRGPNLTSEHTIPGAAVRWALAAYFGESRADDIYDALYKSMTTIIVPNELADVKTPVDNKFTRVLREGFEEGKPLPNIEELSRFARENFIDAATKAETKLSQFALSQLEKQLAMQERQVFGAFLSGDALRRTDYHLNYLGYREQLRSYLNPFDQAVNKLKVLGLSAVENGPRIAATIGQTIAIALSIFGAHKAAHEFEDRQPSATSFLGQVAIDVSTLGFFLTETAVGLVDDAAAATKALCFGDWGYGEYMMESYMQRGMSPTQHRLLNYLAPPR